jgi:formiminoglutamate deiminase
MGAFTAELAWVGPDSGPVTDLGIEAAGGLIATTGPGPGAATAGATRLGGVTVPGFVNAHSHAFHRALRGASETRSGDFWTWRELMYAVAGRLDPDSYRELATCVYGEMVLAGFTAVGEFHYLHHDPAGRRYSDPNEMGWALVDAAEAAGIRLCLLDTCYLQAGVAGEPLEGAQVRFGDGSGEAWSARVERMASSGRFANGDPDEPGDSSRPRLGAAVHSVRAVPLEAMRSVVALAGANEWPLHVHLSEQRAENEACLKVLGRTPVDALASAGVWSRRATAVHATHVSPGDVSRLGLAGASVCACPTTEADLGDGVGPFAELAEAGCTLCLGSDSHAVIDPLQETRSIELNQRLARERRGVSLPTALLAAATSGGASSLGWPAAGLEEGGTADLVSIRTDSPRLSGAELSAADAEGLAARLVFAASAADVTTVVVGGEIVVEGGEHVRLGPPRALADRLSKAICSVLDA